MDATFLKLLEVQNQDEKIYDLNFRISQIPAKIEVKEAELQALEDSLKNAKSESLQVQAKIHDQEVAIQKCNDDIQKLYAKAETVKNNDDYRSLMDQVKDEKQKIVDIEDQELELMEALEGAKARFSEAQEVHNQNAAVVKKGIQEIRDLESGLKSELSSLKSQRDEFAGSVKDVDALRRYERLVAKEVAPGVFRKAFATVIHGACGQCHLTISADLILKAKSHPGKAMCSNCGSYLYILPETAKVE
ncbi:MAG: hypothetical protein MK193_11625 [Lentisphaeria bacterium]|nr:hypothetical protein [Lentisphaeria bacterium]